jgi:amidase
VNAVVEEALARLSAAGARIVDPADIKTISALHSGDDEKVVMLHEFKVGVEAYLASRVPSDGVPPRTLRDLIAFNEVHADSELRWFGQERFEEAEATDGLESPRYRSARTRARRRARTLGIDATLAEHNVVALLVPTLGLSWCIDLVNGDPRGGEGGFRAAAVAGYPSITVPVGASDGLPIGLCLMGGAWDDERLLQIAAGVEAVTQAIERPSFLATISAREVAKSA